MTGEKRNKEASLDGAETPACEGLERIREETVEGNRNKDICIRKGTRNETYDGTGVYRKKEKGKQKKEDG